MRCWAKQIRGWLVALSFVTMSALGADISLRNPLLESGDDGYLLSADFNMNINNRLEEVINKGVVLYFVVEFELTRSRWYWLDEQVVSRSRVFQLSYHALTRKYRLSTGTLHQGFATLDEALRTMTSLRRWQVIERSEVRQDLVYEAGLRMRLDLTQMPKTFQVSALSSREWSLTSDWQRWNFVPRELATTPATGDVK